MRAILDEISSPRAAAPAREELAERARRGGPRSREGGPPPDAEVEDTAKTPRAEATDKSPSAAKRSASGRVLLDDVVVLTQAELEELRGVVGIRGSLVLAGRGVFDLSALASLEHVGSLVVTNTRLRSLAGLRALKSVAGDVVIASDGLRVALDGVDVAGSIIVR